MSVDLAKVLAFIRPGEEWSLDGNTYAGLKWLAPTPKPTPAEIQTGADVLAGKLYLDQRAAHYPPIQDQLNAIWAGGQAMEDMRTKIQAVDATFPPPKP